jgi:uncharacterized protein YacL
MNHILPATGLGVLVAQLSAETVVESVINAGIATLVIWWFMTRTDKQLRSMEERMRRASHEIVKAYELSARANLLLAIALGIKPIQDQANTMLVEVDEMAKRVAAEKEAMELEKENTK